MVYRPAGTTTVVVEIGLSSPLSSRSVPPIHRGSTRTSPVPRVQLTQRPNATIASHDQRQIRLDTGPVGTQAVVAEVSMNLIVSIDDPIVARARQIAERMGTSVEQLVREYLEALVEGDDAELEIEELRRLSQLGAGRSRGWRFSRDQAHESS
jgi:hypothetical protein